VGVEKFIAMYYCMRRSLTETEFTEHEPNVFFSRRTKEGEVREYPTTMDRRREESGDRRVECSTWVWIRAAQFKIYCADAGSRRFLYMRLLSDFERFPALHLTLANTPLHLKQLRDVVQTRPQKKR
jgi:hypothetical protein